ncbi:pilus assembly FimT family protein [Prosthecobacter vanneervenii]|uniref:Type II secretory pathway pseudopilin PulG n=1 Tax=Prosthecobacter vanneervenii TaxID=48466 RepID=A0A7W7YBN8_9BACT|nr:type II secretion system protein [Prosthecobacter vanneervenii]MBB5033247.1 type II secretory pathway pseudopilin PulG [Prosthecobacter vanneervenii]
MTKVRNIANPTPAVLNLQRGFGRSHPAGFTLLEIIVAMALTLLIIGIAAVSISGVRAEDQLRRAAAVIETTARQNLMQALNSQQTVRMDLTSGAFGAGDEFGGMLLVRRYGESAFRKPRRGEAWEFSPTGICEPIEVRISGPAGQIEIGFDPLTACARRKSIQVNG